MKARWMLGTLANAGAVVIGSLLGLLAGRKVPERALVLVREAVGLFTLAIGAGMALQQVDPIVLVFSLVLGALAGRAVGIEKRIEGLAGRLSKGGRAAEGMVTAFLTYCVGPMTVVGSLRDGMGDHTIIFAKAIMDGSVSVAYAASMGVGVALSAVPLLAFQGSLALLGALLGEFLPQASIAAMTAAGGVLLLGVGLRLLEVKKVAVGDMLPAILIAPALAALWPVLIAPVLAVLRR